MPAGSTPDAIEKDREFAETLAQTFVQIDKYVDRLKEFAEMMASARSRIMVALCFREDSPTIIQQAKTWAETPEASDDLSLQ